MKMLPLCLALFCVLLCSCGRKDTNTSSKTLSTDEARQVAMHVLLNRYPKAEIVSQQEAGQVWRYRFATNGVTAPVVVVVDRKASKAHFEKVSP